MDDGPGRSGCAGGEGEESGVMIYRIYQVAENNGRHRHVPRRAFLPLLLGGSDLGVLALFERLRICCAVAQQGFWGCRGPLFSPLPQAAANCDRGGVRREPPGR